MEFLPTLPVLLAFSLAGLALALTPGPDMTLFFSRTIAQGPVAGVVSLMGASCGCLIHTLAAVLGISALLVASPAAFWVLKIVGAFYLLWLAFQAIAHGSTFRLNKTSGAVAPLRNFLMGAGINILNPKVVIFFMTFLPQFVSASDPYAPQKMLFLGIYFIVLTTPLLALVILMSGKFIYRLEQNPKITRVIDYIFGSIFAVFAVKIIFTEAR